MELSDFVERFQGSKTTGGKLFVLCPAHNDTDPSLEISPGSDGKILIYCHAGCKADDVLDAAGLTWADCYRDEKRVDNTTDGVAPFSEWESKKPKPRLNGRPEVVEHYIYKDEFGKTAFRVTRLDPKSFRQSKPHPTDPDRWIPNLAGVRRIPYNLGDVMQAGIKDFVCIVEGEKSADAVKSRLGMIATTFPGGAGKWLEYYADFFHDRRVIVVGDNDKAGKAHAELVAKKLLPVAREVRIVDLSADLDGKQDIYDWIESGKTLEDFNRAILETPVYNGLALPFITVKQLAGMELSIDWIIEKVIPVRTGGALVGPSAAGKTWILLDLALAVATGGLWLGMYPARQGTVALVDEENALPLVQARLSKMARFRGIDLLKDDLPIHLLAGAEVDFTPTAKRGVLEFTPDHFKLVDSLNAMGTDLVIMDSLTRVHRVDENSATEMSNVFSSLKNLMRETDAGVMFTHHYNKAVERSTSNRIRGSSDIRAWLDWAMAITPIEKDESGALEIKVTHDKSRYGEPIDKFKIMLSETIVDGKQKIGFVHRGDIQRGRPTDPDKVDVWEWIKDQLGDGGSIYNSALHAARELTKPCGHRQLWDELNAREKSGQLVKSADPGDARKKLWTLAPDAPNADLADFAGLANQKGL